MFKYAILTKNQFNPNLPIRHSCPILRKPVHRRCGSLWCSCKWPVSKKYDMNFYFLLSFLMNIYRDCAYVYSWTGLPGGDRGRS